MSNTVILYLLMGLPGAGKTTAAKIIEELTGATRLSSDEQRLKLWPLPTFTEAEHAALYDHLNKETERLISVGTSVIYDANLNRLAHRKEKYDLAKKYNVPVVLVWVQAPHSIARQRRIEVSEHHALVPQQEDPASMFDRIAGILEEPTSDEECIVLDGTKISTGYVSETLGL